MITADVVNRPDHTSPDYFRVMREIEANTEPSEYEEARHLIADLSLRTFFKEQAA